LRPFIRAKESPSSSPFPSLKDLIAQVERDHLRQALTLAKGNNNRAIALLGISREKFFERKKLYDL
jgi:DNA-binding NtrC family response regulator